MRECGKVRVWGGDGVSDYVVDMEFLLDFDTGAQRFYNFFPFV